jgi:hypothetical protein
MCFFRCLRNIGLSCVGIILSMQGFFLGLIHSRDSLLATGEGGRPIIWIIQRRKV